MHLCQAFHGFAPVRSPTLQWSKSDSRLVINWPRPVMADFGGVKPSLYVHTDHP